MVVEWSIWQHGQRQRTGSDPNVTDLMAYCQTLAQKIGLSSPEVRQVSNTLVECYGSDDVAIFVLRII